MTNDLIKIEIDPSEYGEAMAALPNDKERAFAVAIFETGGNSAEAARQAGYGNAETSAQSFTTIGNRLRRRPRIVAAMAEIQKILIRTEGPGAIQALREVMNNPGHKDRLKAVGLVLARTDPEITRIEGHVTHEIIDHETEALNQLRALKALGVAREKLIEVYGGFGLDRLEAKLALEEKSKPIEAEYTEITPDPDFNEDGTLKVQP